VNVSDTLDPLCTEFATYLRRRQPAWASFVTIERDSPDEPAYLALEIPPPAPDRPGAWLRCEPDEITIGYDRWHAHYGPWTVPAERGVFEAAADFLDDLLAERVAIAVTMCGEEWRGSQTVAPGERPVPSTGERIYVRSWSGGLDADYDAA
jgi:hypothetical protein